MKRKLLFFTLILAVLFSLSACSGEQNTPQDNLSQSGNTATNNQSQNNAGDVTPPPTPEATPIYYFDEVVLKSPGKYRDGGQEFQIESRDSNYYGEITISGRSYISGTSNDIEGTYALFVTDGTETQIDFTYDRDGFFGTVSLDGAENSGNVVFATNDFYTQYMAYGASFSGSFFERINGLSLVRATWSKTKGGLTGPSFSMLAVVISEEEAIQYATDGTLPKCLQGLTVTGLDEVFKKPDYEPGELELQEAPATDFRYSIANGEVTITKYLSNRANVVIPAMIEGLPVAAVAFSAIGEITDNDTLLSVTIPDGVKTISDYAFRDFTALSSVTIPDSVTVIGRDAFVNCPIKSITIPGGVTEFGGAFTYNTAITSVIISEGVTSIGYSAFDGCESLKSITIPNSVTVIRENAFQRCRSLTSVIIPNGVTIIEAGTFAECALLVSVTIPNTVTTIGWAAFGSCVSLESLAIPNSVTSIDSLAFYGCKALDNATRTQIMKINPDCAGFDE